MKDDGYISPDPYVCLPFGRHITPLVMFYCTPVKKSAKNPVRYRDPHKQRTWMKRLYHGSLIKL